MPRKTHPEKPGGRGAKGRGPPWKSALPAQAKNRFHFDALDYKNVTLLKQFVTDQGASFAQIHRPAAHYQRQLNRSIKRARQMLLMK